MNNRSPAIGGYALVGIVALALLLGGITGDTSDTGSGIGMAIFGALLLSAALSGLLGVLADSRWHVGWALAGFVFPGYSLPFVLYYGLKAWDERARLERSLREAAHSAATAPPRCDECYRPLPNHTTTCPNFLHVPSIADRQTCEWLFEGGTYVPAAHLYAVRCSCGYETAFHPRQEDAVAMYEEFHGCHVNRAGDVYLAPGQDNNGETARGWGSEDWAASPNSVESHPEGDEGCEE